MSNCRKTIVFTGVLSIITIITTWLIATNTCVHELLGNEDVKQFALAISGGLFTGFFVLMLSEVHRYSNLKRETETFAFFQTLYLYQALYEMKTNTLGSLDHPTTVMLESFYDESVRKIQAELSAIQSIEYDTFINGYDSLAHTINCFRVEIPQHMIIVMQLANTLRIGVIKTKISNIENTGQQGFVHPEDSLVKETLTNTLAILDEELKRADGLAAIIDYYCNNRYNWNTYKMSIHENCKSIYELGYGNI